MSRLAVSIMGLEIFAIEVVDDEIEEIDLSENARLTTSDLSFGFAEEREWWGDEEERRVRN